MRKTVMAFFILAAMGLVLGACAKSKNQRIEARPAMIEFDAGIKAYIKKTAIVPGKGGPYGIDPQLCDRFFSATVQILGRDTLHFKLFLPGEDGFPAFAGQWVDDSQPLNISESAGLARINGFNALLSISLADIRVQSRQSGFWFWRGTKYNMTLSATLQILDPFTAAKSTWLVEELTVDTDKATYEAVRDAKWQSLTGIDDALQQLAQTVAQKAAAGLQQLRWQTSVVSVDGNRVGLAAGITHGLAVGDRLAVFEARSISNGGQGQSFIAPGYELGELKIIDIDGDRAWAEVQSGAGIRVGDIAVAAGN